MANPSDSYEEEKRSPSEAAQKNQDDQKVEPRRLMQELKIHQFELQQQNRELRDMQQALEVSRNRYAHLFDWAPVGYCTLDQRGIIREVNLTGALLLGVERGQLLGLPLRQYLDKGQGQALLAHLNSLRTTGLRRTLEVRLKRPGGDDPMDLRLESEPGLGDDGKPLFPTVMLDVTEQQRVLERLRAREQELSRLALHDPLTGLPNRSLFTDRLDQAIADARRNRHRLAVLFIDLDRFKLVNDTFGHSMGDAVLKTVADRLTTGMRQKDTIARIGGDEFLMLAGPIDSPEAAAVIAQKLINALSRPYAGPQGEIDLTTSIGISVYPDDGTSADDLVRNADTAMYLAKVTGRNTFRFFTRAMSEHAVERMRLRSGLGHAVERGELALLYQPLLALGSRRIPGIEALLRWSHASLGCLRPGCFILLAEETGLIDAIDAWVLRSACTQRKRWQAEGLDEGTLIKVNLSRRELERTGFADDLEVLLRELDLDARLLSLELTKTGPVLDSASALETVQRLKRLGVELSIDHFGAAPSALADLKRLPIRELKIDKSLIDGLPQDGDNAAIARAILALGNTLGMRVIAQGVETQDQADFLQDAGCMIAQGFLYTQPLEPDAVMRFVKSWT